ncbi:MAG TPA: hypothetical protein VFC10_03350 [Terriglobia bacterium]|nr:hypothetical protein [Terriglobia bacterium]
MKSMTALCCGERASSLNTLQRQTLGVSNCARDSISSVRYRR